jgi:hypothetical protein
MSDSIKGLSDPEVSPAERYERGLALKKAGLNKAAIDQFEMAAMDLPLTVKAYAQIGLCYIVRPLRRSHHGFSESSQGHTGVVEGNRSNSLCPRAYVGIIGSDSGSAGSLSLA